MMFVQPEACSSQIPPPRFFCILLPLERHTQAIRLMLYIAAVASAARPGSVSYGPLEDAIFELPQAIKALQE